MRERLAFDYITQPDGFAFVIGYLDADGGFAGHAFDEDRLGSHGKAEIVRQAGDSGILDAGIRAKLECGYDRAGIDLRDLAIDTELRAFLYQGAGLVAESLLADDSDLVGAVE